MQQFVDLQVNGYAGVSFNQDTLSAEDLHKACELMQKHQVRAFLATITTEDVGKMCARLTNLAQLRERDELAKSMIAGFHIEGPFINETDGYRGAHPRDAVRPADVDTMQGLVDSANGLVRMVTLAPERDAGFKVISMLAKQKIRVSGGHCDASLDELRGAIDAGLSMFTHLGNGCPMQMHRHDNIIHRVLHFADKLLIGFIADAVHVPLVALRNYLKVAGIQNCYVVSDAVTPAGLGPGRYTWGRWDLVIGEDMVARAPDGSHFVGSAITMPQAYENLTVKLGLSDGEALALVKVNPARIL